MSVQEFEAPQYFHNLHYEFKFIFVYCVLEALEYISAKCLRICTAEHVNALWRAKIDIWWRCSCLNCELCVYFVNLLARFQVKDDIAAHNPSMCMCGIAFKN